MTRLLTRRRRHMDDWLFDNLCGRNLVYNACWEDPAVDLLALDIHPVDTMLVITSAGCNVLDYLLAEPRKIYAIDVNPRQNALLELKIAAIRGLDHDDFFQLFGLGRHADFFDIYRQSLRPQLSSSSRDFWDRNGHWFAAGRGASGLYDRGLAGRFARLFRSYLGTRQRLRDRLTTLMESDSLERQQSIYDEEIRHRLWTPTLEWLLSRQLSMTLLGVPKSQRVEVERQHPAGVAGFIRDAVDYVFRELPIGDNYFWNLYIRGHYTRECCPRYLRKRGFLELKRGLVDRVEIHTSTVSDFLAGCPDRISRYVLLDHMDWMGAADPEGLNAEWRQIVAHADHSCRIIFRSAHAEPRYLDQVRLDRGEPLMSRLFMQRQRARLLQRLDRVHTYAGFHIADLLPAS